MPRPGTLESTAGSVVPERAVTSPARATGATAGAAAGVAPRLANSSTRVSTSVRPICGRPSSGRCATDGSASDVRSARRTSPTICSAAGRRVSVTRGAGARDGDRHGGTTGGSAPVPAREGAAASRPRRLAAVRPPREPHAGDVRRSPGQGRASRKWPTPPRRGARRDACHGVQFFAPAQRARRAKWYK